MTKELAIIRDVVKNTEQPLYWLAVYVAQGQITEAEAGLIISVLDL